MTLLLRMLGGSHLYGTNHVGSDFDWFEVHDHCQPYHKVSEVSDLTRWPLSQFMRLADKGAHNALDMMMAPRGWPEVDLIEDLRMNYRADPVACWHRFHSTAEGMRARNGAKGERHAERILRNLEQVMATGRYDPRS